ncbi:hypothetical protein [Mesorhizobium sp.]|uniref:hypothetical protein n=1 Tax=Mesorhizobium sp. TaxID=1871066 RepID=UPI000FE915F3|nr:hypothetical protein [Mesorhizobium sp.]RWK11853.1 MAG: hypothetical protein EOR39_06975 [Mesorhizobium sp.]TIQ49052.1 MAG: helix-turn-helix domain-containing protein [Mesorhizobium sp.]TIQ58869.1 MAG: helix-turn-helix domain-containing protein [Mesorhizobium sp.]
MSKSKDDQSNLPTKGRATPKGGFSVREFARRAGLPEGRVRKAVRSNQIETVDFGGTHRIPPRELERVCQLYK